MVSKFRPSFLDRPVLGVWRTPPPAALAPTHCGPKGKAQRLESTEASNPALVAESFNQARAQMEMAMTMTMTTLTMKV